MTEPARSDALKLLRQSDGVLLYGAGRVGRDVARVLSRDGVRIVSFLDRNAAAGDKLLGIPVHRPEACPLTARERARVPVVLSIFNRDVDIRTVATKLRELGFEYFIPFVDLHAEYFDELGDRFWLTDRRYVESHQAEIREAQTIWADELSHTLFRSLVALRQSGTHNDLVTPSPHGTQYFPSDLPNWPSSRPLRFVDCGAYNGDTLAALLRLNLPVDALAHFEPDPENFKALARFVQDHREEIDAPVALWPCAVSDKSQMVKFREGQEEGSSVSADGAATVQAVALDDVLCGWDPSFIKMDIEGAEPDGLLGARQLICQNLPELAICIYHRPGHLWQIPLLLREWKELANYRYYLRIHGHDGFDTVLYARPESSKAATPAR